MEDIDVDEKRDWTENYPTKEKVRRKGPRSSCPPIHGSSFVASSPETEAPWSLTGGRWDDAAGPHVGRSFVGAMLQSE